MQLNQLEADSATNNLTINHDSLPIQGAQVSVDSQSVYVFDPSTLDSLSLNYVAPDSVITFGYLPEWSQFRGPYNVKGFDFEGKLVKQLPYDSLHTVLKGVEVVFPGKKIFRSNPDWLIGVLLICLVLFATVRLIFNKYLSQLMQSTINYSTFTRMLRERYFNFLHASFRLDIVFNVTIALFSYQFLALHKINFGLDNSFYVFSACLGIVIGYFTAKRLLYYLLGILTESRQEVHEYLFSITVYNRVLGAFLLHFSAVAAFIPLSQVVPVFYSGIALIAAFYIMSLARGVKIFLKKQFSISYLILYLCTLEFLPLILLYFVLPF